MTLLDWAIDAHTRGFAIFPCRPKAKQPATMNGVKDATKDIEKIKAWWEENPDYNIGVALGPSNLTVLDMDTGIADLDAAREWVRRNQLPNTFTVRTGRRTSFGLQLYFSGTVQNRPYDHDGVSGEIRSSGYYVVGPGSIHPDSSEPYVILADRKLAPVPDLVNRLSRFVLPRPQGKSQEKVTPSCRHYYFVERGRELYFAGLTGEGLHAALKWLYENRCVRDPQKDDRVARGELKEIGQWIEQHPPEYPLEPRDFMALHHAEKDPMTQQAWAGQLNFFDNNPDKALDYLIHRFDSIGCNREQIYRVIGASPLYASMKEAAPK